ncbi:MAG: hypothetical protein OHK0024_24370 [Thalassobaculales bacterium]
MALADIQALVDNLVRDTSGTIASTERDRAIGLAVQRYSTDRPRLEVIDVTAAGGQSIDMPEGWIAGFSRLVAVEQPAGEVPPAIWPDDTWRLYQGPAATVIHLARSVAAGASARLTITMPHMVSAEVDTIPAPDREAVACWAAALLLDQLAAAFSGDKISTIQAEVANPVSKGAEYAKRAAAARARYFAELGLDARRNAPASATVEFTPRDDAGRRRLFHPGPMA